MEGQAVIWILFDLAADSGVCPRPVKTLERHLRDGERQTISGGCVSTDAVKNTGDQGKRRIGQPHPVCDLGSGLR
jgi:hypothetical protein